MIYFSNKILLIILFILLICISQRYLEKSLLISKIKSIGIIIILTGILLISILALRSKYGINSFSMHYLFLIYILIMITIHDIKDKTIPTDWLVLGTTIGLVFLIYNPNIKLLEGIVGSCLFFFGLYTISKLSKGGIGIGDVLIFALISFLTGWKMTITILILALLLSGMLGLILYVVKKIDKKTSIPFMPFILIAILFILWV